MKNYRIQNTNRIVGLQFCLSTQPFGSSVCQFSGSYFAFRHSLLARRSASSPAHILPFGTAFWLVGLPVGQLIFCLFRIIQFKYFPDHQSAFRSDAVAFPHNHPARRTAFRWVAELAVLPFHVTFLSCKDVKLDKLTRRSTSTVD